MTTTQMTTTQATSSERPRRSEHGLRRLAAAELVLAVAAFSVAAGFAVGGDVRPAAYLAVFGLAALGVRWLVLRRIRVETRGPGL
jgi:hypothetical protein